MLYRFGDCSLDTATCELRVGGRLTPLEPQVLALLRLLIENRRRLVSKDEVIAAVWGGRIVSEAAVASRLKAVRQAIGDDGAAQRMIRTVPKLGIRFVAEVETLGRAEPRAGAPAAGPTQASARPAIAVLPFRTSGAAGPPLLGEALADDVITELSRLRWLFVIARGSSFRFRDPEPDLDAVRAALGVGYVLSGAVQTDGGLSVRVELADARDHGVVWRERFEARLGEVHQLRAELVRAAAAALELHVPVREALLAQHAGPERLEAWQAYHLGLRQLFRFRRTGNAAAVALFEQALAREPEFARAHAGLSFAHFEAAFLSFAQDRAAAVAAAERSAEAALERDPLDPFCSLVMGRSQWLKGELEASLPWLDRAIALNPNYAQAKYSRAWAETLLGRPREGQANAAEALALSPLDPLAYGMVGVRALSHLLLDEPEDAARWAEQAARTPGAHAFIELIAAIAHLLNGERGRAEARLASARRRAPGLSQGQFFAAFPFRDQGARERLAGALQRLGA